jgi:hypothetical protein
VVANLDQIREDSGQRTPHAHGGPLRAQAPVWDISANHDITEESFAIREIVSKNKEQFIRGR